MAARVWVIWTTGRARAASGWSGQEKLHTCVCTRASVAREDCHVGGALGGRQRLMGKRTHLKRHGISFLVPMESNLFLARE